jgi:threonine synthase
MDKIIPQIYNIWRYANYYDHPPSEENRFTLEEGWTGEIEIKELSRELGIKNLIFKREDLNPNGSHKDRALAFQISKYKELGEKRLLISTSGNAGISCASYGRLARIPVYIFASPKTRRVKIEQIKTFGGNLIITNHAINFAKQISRELDIPNLRPSMDDYSVEGFKSLGFELFETVGDIDSVFVFVSSGSSYVGIAQAFHYLKEKINVVDKIPRMHVVQTGTVNSIVSRRKPVRSTTKARSLTGDLGVKKTRRMREILNWLSATGGKSWFVSDEETLNAIRLLNSYGIDTSVEGAANFAGVIQAAESENLGNVVCLLTGHASQWRDREDIEPAEEVIDDYEAVKEIFGR